MRGACLLALPTLLLALLTSVGPAKSADSRRVPARVTESGSGRLVFRIALEQHVLQPSKQLEGFTRLSVPGFVPVGDPGEPALPSRQFLVALPPEGAYRVTSRVLASADLGSVRFEPVPFPAGSHDEDLGPVLCERYRFEPSAFDQAPVRPLVRAEEHGWIRRNRVLPLVVNPVTWDPAGGEAFLATEIEVTVTFSGGSPDRSSPARREAPMWDGIFGRMVVNPDQAREWRSPRQSGFSRSGVAMPALQSGVVRLKVRETGIHRVTASNLVSVGFPSGEAISNLRLFQRSYDDNTFVPATADIPFHVEEGSSGTPGIFDGSDRIIFHGRRLRHDPGQGDTLEKFSDHNIYWLGAGGGSAIAERSLVPGFISADTSSASFPVADHFEIDLFFREGTRRPFDDFYYYNSGTGSTVLEMPFHVGNPASDVTIRAELHGQFYTTDLRVLSIDLRNSQGNYPLSTFYAIPGKDRRVFEATVPVSRADTGTNWFSYRNNITTDTPETHINWVEVEYDSRYRARGNSLSFNTGSLSGDTSLTVTGISDSDLWLFDVTDPIAPVRCVLDPGLFTDVGGSQALSFRDNIASRRD